MNIYVQIYKYLIKVCLSFLLLSMAFNIININIMIALSTTKPTSNPPIHDTAGDTLLCDLPVLSPK